MIDAFLRSVKPIDDLSALLKGFTCQQVLVRDGGPTQLWRRGENGWAKVSPGMILFADLTPDFIGFDAYRSEGCGTRPVEEHQSFILNKAMATEWLALMIDHAYDIEDAFGCSVDVDHDGQQVHCADGLLSISHFRAMHDKEEGLPTEVLSWTDQALEKGADQISFAISIARNG